MNRTQKVFTIMTIVGIATMMPQVSLADDPEAAYEVLESIWAELPAAVQSVLLPAVTEFWGPNVFTGLPSPAGSGSSGVSSVTDVDEASATDNLVSLDLVDTNWQLWQGGGRVVPGILDPDGGTDAYRVVLASRDTQLTFPVPDLDGGVRACDVFRATAWVRTIQPGVYARISRDGETLYERGKQALPVTETWEQIEFEYEFAEDHAGVRLDFISQDDGLRVVDIYQPTLVRVGTRGDCN